MEYVETIENLKMVLEERERNIELAARIGQSLLERNKELQNRIEILEHSQYESRLEISNLKEEANQLKHSLQIKDEIISEIEDERLCQKEAEISSSISIENERLKLEIRQLENQLKDTENRWEISSANQKEEFDLELMRKEKKIQALKEDLIQKGNDIQELYAENSKLTSRIFHLERDIRQKDIKIIHVETELENSRRSQSLLVSELNFLETRVLELQSLIDQSRRDQYQHDIAQLAERNLASEIASPKCLNGLSLARTGTIRPNPKLPQRRMTSTKTEDDFNSEESNANSDSGVDDFETCIYSEILELSAVPKLDLDLDIDLKTPTKDVEFINQPEPAQVCASSNLPKPVQKYSKGRLPIELHSPATLLVAKLKKDFDDFEILSPMAASSTTKFTYPRSLSSKPCQQEPSPKTPICQTKEPPAAKSRLKTKIIQMFKTKKPNQLKRSASTFDLIRTYPLQFRF